MSSPTSCVGGNTALDVLIELIIPYEQTYIPWRHRTPKTTVLTAKHCTVVRSIDVNQAPVACKITKAGRHPRGSRRQVLIRSFEDKLWWPLMCDGAQVSAAEFSRRASYGSRALLEACGCREYGPYPGWKHRADFEKFSVDNPGCRFLGSTLEAQIRMVDRSTTKFVFIDGWAYAAAAAPIYYLHDRNDTGFRIFAGTASLDVPGGHIYVAGLDLKRRTDAAASGNAFHPLDLPKAHPSARHFMIIDTPMGLAKNFIRDHTSTYALAERIREMARSHVSYSGYLLRSCAPLMDLIGENWSTDIGLRRKVLEKLILTKWPESISEEFRRVIASATFILDCSKVDDLTDSEEDALAVLGKI